MATPFPDPEEARKKRSWGARRSRAATALLATPAPSPPPPPVSQVPTKISVGQQPVTGPSGIKQCYRTVKSVRRIPILHNPNPPPSTSSSTSSVISNPTPSKKQHQHVCKQCHKRFNSPGKLSQHTLSHTGELPFTCPSCDKKFNSKFKLVRHGLIHNERQFSCSTCNKTFHRKDHLVNHERTHSPTKVPYKCDKDNCNKQYTSLLSFKKHQALHSAEEGNLECKICLKTFDKKEDIVYHLKVHAGSRTVKNENDKKFKCSFCERKFFTGKDVRRHLVVHTGSREFHCKFCTQRFGRKDHLVRHVKKAHPTENLQSPTIETSSVPVAPKPPPTVTRKGKGEGKKTKTKAEVKLTGKVFGESEEISIKQEQISAAIEGSGLLQFDAPHQVQLAPSAMQEGLLDIQQSPMFIPCEKIVQIKPEPDIKIEEARLLYESLPSTSKDVGPFIVQPSEPLPSTSIDEDFARGMLQYIMPEYPLSNLEMARLQTQYSPPDVAILPQEGLSFIEDKESLNILEETIILEEEEQREQPKTVLPTFKDVFLSSTQSPKPPQPPPK